MFSRAGIVVALTLSTLVAGDKTAATYLAIGDSIAFGYDPSIHGSPASSFTGYPEVIVSNSSEQKKPVTLLNLSCPGESSGSFLDASKPDFHCREYKSALGLHVPYQGTQMSEALLLLGREGNVDLITMNLGGNDLVLLQLNCKLQAACIVNALPGVLEEYGRNLAAILTAFRVNAGYKGRIVFLTQYSLDYRDPLTTGAISALNSVALEVASHFGVTVADGFAAFQRWAAKNRTQGDTCSAGLLIRMPNGACDVHPTSRGQRLLSDTIGDMH